MNKIYRTIITHLIGMYKFWKVRELVRPYLKTLNDDQTIVFPRADTIVDGIAQQFWRLQLGYQPYTADEVINKLPHDLIEDLAKWEEFEIWQDWQLMAGAARSGK